MAKGGGLRARLLDDLQVPEVYREPAKKRGGGRPSTYTPEIGSEVCRRLIDPEPRGLNKIAQDDDMPTVWTFFKWLNQYPEFANLYARARVCQGHLMAERALEEGLAATPETANAARVRMDALKWAAAHLTPHVYGDRPSVVVQQISEVDSDRRRELRQQLLHELAGLARPAPLVIEHET